MPDSNGADHAAAAGVIPILMPQAGQSMEEGTIIKWLVKPGDRIEVGQIIMEIETDKATIEVEAVEAGRLARIIAAEDATIPVLQPVAYLAERDADVDAWLKLTAGGGATAPAATVVTGAGGAPAADAPLSPGASAAQLAGGRIKASPAARNIAAQRGVALEQIARGSGPYGRILSADVPAVPPVAVEAVATAATSAAGGEQRQKLSKLCKAIARNLLASKQTIPHFYLKRTINAEPLRNFYNAEKAKCPCSVNDVIVLACSRAMAEFPAFRSRLDGDELVESPHANIGIAVGLEQGLVVPVIVAAERLSLRELAAESRRIVAAAREGKIENMGRGNFTISNLGMFGVDEFSAIINPPEAAILAVGAIREAVIAENGALRAGFTLTVTLSCDHRIIDGVLAARFAGRLKELLEAPEELLQLTMSSEQ